ncbi:MAG TPA: metal-dependent hydrolase [Accumulibacter sp.]|jgi:inner membrane protein|nr:metal-dependent hydrolase [Accumulibacter sp.]
MPTILSHAVVPLAIGLGAGRDRVSPALLLDGAAASMLPDLDVLAFHLGVAYAHPFGHRGFSHSLLFALALGLAARLLAPRPRASRLVAFCFVFLATASHGLLDAFTTGGMGVALLWPLTETRFFAPWRVIQVSPLSLNQIFGAKGLAVLLSELKWVWAPAFAVGGMLALLARFHQPPATRQTESGVR